MFLFLMLLVVASLGKMEKKPSYLCDSSGNNNPTWKCEREGVVCSNSRVRRPPQNKSGLSAPRYLFCVIIRTYLYSLTTTFRAVSWGIVRKTYSTQLAALYTESMLSTTCHVLLNRCFDRRNT